MELQVLLGEREFDIEQTVYRVQQNTTTSSRPSAANALPAESEEDTHFRDKGVHAEEEYADEDDDDDDDDDEIECADSELEAGIGDVGHEDQGSDYGVRGKSVDEWAAWEKEEAEFDRRVEESKRSLKKTLKRVAEVKADMAHKDKVKKHSGKAKNPEPEMHDGQDTESEPERLQTVPFIVPRPPNGDGVFKQIPTDLSFDEFCSTIGMIMQCEPDGRRTGPMHRRSDRGDTAGEGTAREE